MPSPQSLRSLVALLACLPIAATAAEYPRPELLIEPAELAQSAKAYTILDARPRDAYKAGHIPGAVPVPHGEWEKAFHADEGRDAAAWGARIKALGVTNEMPVVVYDDNLSKDAARIWWILKYFGVKEAKLLNGGWKGWAAAGLPVSKDTPEIKPSDFRAAPRPAFFRDKADLLGALKMSDGVQIVDARSEAEHCGDDPLRNSRVGAIPGAKHLEWSDLLDKETARFKPPGDLQELFADAGIDPKRPTVTHCQSGGRASVMAFGLELMGGDEVANYYRGWSEWGNSEETPVEKSEPSASKRPPNVVFVIADDLGVGELGSYGQKWIKTPNLDRLAAEGMRFTQHYSGFPVCAPARCSLMTGRHAGHCYIRDNGNPPGRVADKAKDLWPGQNPIPDDAVTIPELFKARGYATGAMGKWGLGYEGSTGDPGKQGFDLFFGYICQAHAHNHYPTFLWRITPDDREQVRYPGNTGRDLTGTAYSQDEFFRQADAFVEANKDCPFFLYLPVIVTHLSIQVPEDEPSLAEYRRTIPEEAYEHKGAYLKHPTPRAAYAAMVTRMDREIGELVEKIESLGLGDDTIFVFTSDNGPAHEPRFGGTDSTFFDSAQGRRGRKGDVYEGGIREPLIVRWSGQVPAGGTSDLPTYFADWMPTLFDLTGAADAVPSGVDGLSFAPTLLGRPEGQKKHDFLYWEFPSYGGQQAVRSGDWKAVRRDMARLKPGEKPKTEIYDLAADPNETTDVSAEHPDVAAKLEAIMAEQHEPSELFPLPGVDASRRTRRPSR